MKYNFPTITHLDDVLPAIEGRDEFIVADRGNYKVVNYLVNMADTFPAVDNELMAIRRECRGLVFDSKGKLIARRFHKFFNVGEKEETQPHLIDLKQKHFILEKLDGSMITPIMLDSITNIHMATKMGITDIALEAQKFIDENSNYKRFMLEEILSNYTPIFEYCSRKNRVVIDYPEDRMVLLASRHNITGEYLDYSSLKNIADDYGIEVVKTYSGTVESMTDLVSQVRGMEDIEGYVLRFDDGHMVKIKAEQYVLQHGAMDSITHEKNVLEMVLNNTLDDVKTFLNEKDYQRLEAYSDAIYKAIEQSVFFHEDYYNRIKHLNKKDFALSYMDNAKKIGIIPSIIFSMFDGKDARNLLVKYLQNNCSTQTKVDSIRHLLGNIDYRTFKC